MKGTFNQERTSYKAVYTVEDLANLFKQEEYIILQIINKNDIARKEEGYNASIVAFIAETLLADDEYRTYSVGEIAEKHGLNVKTVQMKIYRKGIKPVKKVGTNNLYSYSDMLLIGQVDSFRKYKKSNL